MTAKIRSLQRGTGVIASFATTDTVAITAVDLNRTNIINNGTTGNNASSSGVKTRVTLNSATQVGATRGAGPASRIVDFNFEVIEEWPI